MDAGDVGLNISDTIKYSPFITQQQFGFDWKTFYYLRATCITS